MAKPNKSEPAPEDKVHAARMAELDKREADIEKRAANMRDAGSQGERIEEMLARLEQRETELEAREEAMNLRTAGELGGGSFPRPHQAEPNVRAIVVSAREYLKDHHYQPGLRELQLMEAIAHAFYSAERK